ncbi:MAG: carboxypeptidase regulatory-like domain-containing protein, partial [Acidobacteria bacterium]|nr:carboxypeptidase regulatory-like domain-containing protein [Acidobacteriota bacterium]
MKPATFVLSAVLLLQSPAPATQQPPRKASIEGTVVRIGTGEPVAARVLLYRGPAATPGPATPPQHSVSTDVQGRFILKDIDPGTYRLTVVANGYARLEYGQRVPGGAGTPIELRAGQAMTDLAIRMTPAGYVTGRITDETGMPAIGAQVQLARVSYTSTAQRIYQTSGTSRVDDRGEYRLYWVTPGRYYVLAGSIFSTMRPLENGAGDSPNGIQERYAVAFYPGVMD